MDDKARTGRLRRMAQPDCPSIRMPEGPSLVILREQAQAFEGRRILRIEHNTTMLLDQGIFPGVGNIIRNEVLFRIRVLRCRAWARCRRRSRRELVREARTYSFQFLAWKKAFVLRKHWLAHTRRTCPRCDIPFHKGHLGLTQRRSFWCENCQRRYG